MRILVTGGAGFIASHIAELYLQEGHQVAIVDDLSQGQEKNIPQGAHFYRLDILDPHLEEVFSRERPEVVNHHAAQIDVRKSITDPAVDAKINILGTLSLLKWAQRLGTRQVIFASSGGTIYGEEGTFPFSEGVPPRPKSPYGLSKYVGECYLELYRALFGLDSVILRYSNVYGPRQDPMGEAGVVAIFSQNILNGKPVTVFGDGTQTRDYVFVSDVAEANLLALKVKGSHVLNIATQMETSVNELIHLLEDFLTQPLARIDAPARPGELQRSCLAISLAQATLGWRPRVGLQEGLQETFRWFQQALRRKAAP
jgi:UDP-glucose 4-epimerase